MKKTLLRTRPLKLIHQKPETCTHGGERFERTLYKIAPFSTYCEKCSPKRQEINTQQMKFLVDAELHPKREPRKMAHPVLEKCIRCNAEFRRELHKSEPGSMLCEKCKQVEHITRSFYWRPPYSSVSDSTGKIDVKAVTKVEGKHRDSPETARTSTP